MSNTGGCDCGAPPEKTAVAAVKGDNSGGFNRGRGSRRAVRWAVQNLMPKANRFILVQGSHFNPHSRDRVTRTSYTPYVVSTAVLIVADSCDALLLAGGDHVAVAELDENVVATYVEEMKVKYEQVFAPFKTEMFKNTRKQQETKTCVLES